VREATLDLLPSRGRVAPLNPWAAVIVAALLLQFVLELVADVLNLRSLRAEPPAEFRALFDAERYRRAQEYTRTRTVFGLVTAAFDLLLVLGFWFSGGFAALDQAVHRLGFGPIATGLLFIGALGLGWVILHVPLRWWSTFVIEARFGFNRTAPQTFWTDLGKGLLLTVVLGTPLLAGVLWLFETVGPGAWLWCWLASALYAIGVQFVAPAWIMPLFNRFTPLAPGALREAILAYARSVGFPLEGVFVIDGSRRSSKANALFTGFGRHRRVALFDTLVEKLGPDEVVAVVAHEIGHYKRHHVVQGMAIGILELGVLFFLLSITLRQPGLFDAFYLHAPSVHAGLVVFALVLTPLESALSVALNALSRHNEREADAFAATTTGSGTPLARGLTRLAIDSLANLTPHPLHVLLHASHPPVIERVRDLARQPQPT
jgi:STE24 endopeptidase